MVPEPPDILTGEALDEWNRIVPTLAAEALVDDLDMPTIAAYCRVYARWREAEKRLDESGLIVVQMVGDERKPMDSPYLAIANRALDQMRALAEQIGLSSQRRIRTRADVHPQSPVDRALFGAGRSN